MISSSSFNALFFFLLDYKYFRYLNIVVTFKFTNFESHLDM